MRLKEVKSHLDKFRREHNRFPKVLTFSDEQLMYLEADLMASYPFGPVADRLKKDFNISLRMLVDTGDIKLFGVPVQCSENRWMDRGFKLIILDKALAVNPDVMNWVRDCELIVDAELKRMRKELNAYGTVLYTENVKGVKGPGATG